MKKLEEKLSENEAMILMDFKENIAINVAPSEVFLLINSRLMICTIINLNGHF